MSALTRRRFLTIAGATALVAGGAFPAAQGAVRSRGWTGMALGAKASIHLDGVAPGRAKQVIEACLSEIARLEGVLSLYRDDSQLAVLNRTGRLDQPDPALLAVLSLAGSVHRASNGAFDPTVQPLWRALAERHRGAGGARDLGAAKLVVGFDGVRIEPARISFIRPGMALTLNGIAQGFITDRIAELLRAHGLTHVLVDIGEMRALDGRDDATPWPVSIRSSVPDAAPAKTLRLRERALATSETLATTFDAGGKVGHILDPRSGRPARSSRLVSVEADTAALADALSTALCVMPLSAHAGLLRRFPGARLAHLV